MSQVVRAEGEADAIRIADDSSCGGAGRFGYGRERVGLGLEQLVGHKLIGVTEIDGEF